MNKKNKIVVIGSSNTDMVISAAHFPKPGETIMGHGFLSNHGGKGANQAVAAARLGGDVSFIGKVGNDSLGESAFEMLGREGIDLSCMTSTDEQPSGVALITLDSNGENTIIVNPGANGMLSEEDIEKSEPVIREAKIMLMQLETPVRTLVRAARMAKRYGVYVVLNPAPFPGDPLPEELLENTDLLIPNETEAMAIAGVDTFDADTAPLIMKKIQETGVKDVVITMGSKGVLTSIGGHMVAVPACKVKAVDTTAAGDTFCGALCVALCNGAGMEESLKFANAASSITVTRMGAQISMPYLQEVKNEII